MSPYEFSKFAERVLPALEKLGWRMKFVNRQGEHEDRTSQEEIIVNAAGTFLLDMSDLSEAMAEELIRIAG